MTIEQKAKAYDKALEKARIYRDNAKAVEDYSAVARYENIFPELHKEEKPLTPFQQCLNCILRGAYYAEVPDEKVNEFIVNIVRTRTDELIKLAKIHKYTDCQLHKSEDEQMIQEFNDWLCEEIECRTSDLRDEEDRRTLNMLCYILTKVKEWLEKHKEQKPNIEICPHSIKSKSYKENGYPIENCDYGLEIALAILEKTLGEVQGYQTDDGLREHQTAIKAVKDAMKEQKPAWSEDERMLKKIIEYLEMIKMGCVICTIDTSEEIAWLERKKIPSVSFNPALGFDPGSAVVYHNDDSEDERMRKLIIDRVRSATEMTEGLRELLLSYLEKQEQKPAECIEDSVKFEEGFKVGRESGLRDGQKYVLNNLDSYGLCKPAWSEEDEKNLELVTDCVYEFYPDPVMKYKLKDWLNNLRPSWKPSEEQIYSLGTVVKGVGDANVGSVGYNLKQLYEQLKSL